MNNYPTKEEIIATIPHLDVKEYIPVLQLWKKNYYTKKWKTLTLPEKHNALRELIQAISLGQTQSVLDYCYSFNPDYNLIRLDFNHPSILSTLHELGHSIHGSSELLACSFSIKLFEEVFPTERQKLEWFGHMLKLPT